MFSSFLTHPFNAQNEIFIGGTIVMGSECSVRALNCSPFCFQSTVRSLFYLDQHAIGLKGTCSFGKSIAEDATVYVGT